MRRGPDRHSRAADVVADLLKTDVVVIPVRSTVAEAAATLADLIGRRPVTARPEWLLDRALRTLENAGVKRLPVVDGGGRLLGVVSREALVAAAERQRRPRGS